METEGKTNQLAICPKCGLNREAAWSNYQAGDGTAKYLFMGCSGCRAWWKEKTDEQ